MEALLVGHVGPVPVLIGLAMYFLPSIIAAARGHHQLAPIIVINLFLAGR